MSKGSDFVTATRQAYGALFRDGARTCGESCSRSSRRSVYWASLFVMIPFILIMRKPRHLRGGGGAGGH